MATTAIIFGRSHTDAMLSLQLRSMALIAQREHWLLNADHLECYDPGSSGLLGQGSFGLVFRGEYLGVPVAVKVPKLADCRGIAALANELRVFRRHPYIVAFYGALVAEDDADLVLVEVEELVDGPSLWDFVLKSSSPLDAGTKRNILLCICNALVYLHDQEPTVVHGDLGASNVIVQKFTWQPKLIDFGLSRIRGQKAPMGGTSRWAAPEVVLGGALPDPSADVFSFGRLAYFVVSGQEPLEGLGHGDILHLAQQGSLPDLCWADTSSTKALALQHECQVLCRKSLVFNCNRRAKSVELAEELEAWPEPGHVRHSRRVASDAIHAAEAASGLPTMSSPKGWIEGAGGQSYFRAGAELAESAEHVTLTSVVQLAESLRGDCDPMILGDTQNGLTTLSYLEYQFVMLCLACAMCISLGVVELLLKRFQLLPMLFPGVFHIREKHFFFFDMEVRDVRIGKALRWEAMMLTRVTFCVVLSYLWEHCVIQTTQRVGNEFPVSECLEGFDCFASELAYTTIFNRDHTPVDCKHPPPDMKNFFSQKVVVSCVSFVPPEASKWFMHLAIAHSMVMLTQKAFGLLVWACGNSRWMHRVVAFASFATFTGFIGLFFSGVMTQFVSSWVAFVMSLSVSVFFYIVWKSGKIFQDLWLAESRALQTSIEMNLSLALADLQQRTQGGMSAECEAQTPRADNAPQADTSSGMKSFRTRAANAVLGSIPRGILRGSHSTIKEDGHSKDGVAPPAPTALVLVPEGPTAGP
ncbi:unnamed protein product [Polarella glacialis]|uniref:Protein kinase domain-containing protein n=1 Tax=Polarella glacialis TaxID=89957 RepID=A0A813GPV1_POLGL|nr:unnamed protein product [Polarella glacialis]